MVDEVSVRAAVESIEDPDVHRTLGALGAVRGLEVEDGGAVRVTIGSLIPNNPGQDEIAGRIAGAVAAVAGVTSVEVEFVDMTDEERATALGAIGASAESAAVAAGARVIAIASGKGGVGKSSVTANLGVALADVGKRIGIIDADVWGFSIPRMLGIERAPTVIEQKIFPPMAHGVSAISMDFFVQPDQAVIWRGPMLHKALEQFLTDVHWDLLDYLLIDMPPGTGDVAISISQFLPRAQAIIVTTPQPTAQRVAKRAGLMARKVNQEILGVVENMSWFTGDDAKRYHIFGEGGGEMLAAELEVPLLGQIPLLPGMREGADDGRPVLAAAPDSDAADAFRQLARRVEDLKPRLRSHPELVIR